MYIDRFEDNGVSPVIGVILMVAITVALSATVAFVATDIGDNVNQNSRAGVSMEEIDSGVQISVTTMGNTESLQTIVNGTEVGPELTSAGDTVTVTAPEDATVSVRGTTESGNTTLVDSVTTSSDTTTDDPDSPSVVESESDVSSNNGDESGDGGTDDSTESVSEPSSSAPSDLSTVLSEMEGSGTSDNPYVIMNDQQLQAMNADKTAHYVLGQNIDASETESWNGGNGFDPIMEVGDAFTGSLDGQGYEVQELYISRTNYTGLIGFNSGTLSNVGIVDADINGDQYVGSLVGHNQGGSVSNSYVTGSVSGDTSVGGLVGLNSAGGSVSESYVTSSVTGGYSAGGLVGNSDGSGSSITDSYATGSVTGSDYVGGLVGQIGGGSIMSSYATGSVSSDTNNVGGFVGYKTGGDVSSSYWNTSTTGQDTSAGSATGLTTTEMQEDTTNTMSAFDFDAIWVAGNDSEYPRLKWQSN